MAELNEMFAELSVSISRLKANPTAVINDAEGAPVAVLNNNVPTAYLVPAETYGHLMEKLEDLKIEKELMEEFGAKLDKYAKHVSEK